MALCLHLCVRSSSEDLILTARCWAGLVWAWPGVQWTCCRAWHRSRGGTRYLSTPRATGSFHTLSSVEDGKLGENILSETLAIAIAGLSFFFFKIYLFIQRELERGRDTGRGRSRPHTGSPMRDSIPGPQDHTPGRNEPPRHPNILFLKGW